MLKIFRIAALLFCVAFISLAQEQPAAKSASGTSPIRREITSAFNGAANRALALAKAIPQDKYAWRPMEGVRSFNEVFMHMAGGTLLFLSYAGMQSPTGAAHDLATVYMKRGFEMPEIFASERTVTNKDKVVEIMDQAFNQARDCIRNMQDADLDKPVEFFGRTTTIRGVLIVMGDHLSEHLGQSIAYARVNGIVPPWSRKPE